jgi:hypothetical protein
METADPDSDPDPGHHMNSQITGMLENGIPVDGYPILQVPKMDPFADFDKKGKIYSIGAACHMLLDNAGL